MNLASKRGMCEDCKEKHAGFGLGVDKKRRWCGACAKTYEGAMNLASKPHMLQRCTLCDRHSLG